MNILDDFSTALLQARQRKGVTGRIQREIER